MSVSSDTDLGEPSSSTPDDELANSKLPFSIEDDYVRKKDATTGRYLPTVPKVGVSRRLGEGQGHYKVEAKEAFNPEYRPQAGVHFHTLLDEQILLVGEGKHVPCVQSFEEMKLHPALLANIVRLGYKEPLPIQKATFSLIAKGYDVVAHAQTGGGKTAAFMIPVINRILNQKENHDNLHPNTAPYCIVISPTRELAEQLYHSACEFSFETKCQPFLSMGDIWIGESRSKLRQGCDMYFGTIGRSLDFVANKILQLHNVQFVVFDEADDHLARQEFLAVEKILLERCKQLENLQTLLFSATNTQDVQDFCEKSLRPCATRVVVGNLNAVTPHVEQVVVSVEETAKRLMLLRILRTEFSQKESHPRVLVFVNSKRRSTVLACYLSLNDFRAYPINGNMTTSLRHQAVEAFEKGSCSIIVATDVLSRGVDLKDVSMVINYDLPPVEKWAAYVHRIGRTGRLGNEGRAITFYKPSTDARMAHLLYQWLSYNDQHVPSFLIDDALPMYTREELAEKAQKDYLTSLMQTPYGAEDD